MTVPSREERFHDKWRLQGECWIWTATVNFRGYGRFSDGGKLFMAHRWAYERFVGPIQSGLTLDHLCRNPSCVNPKHLEQVTLAENIRRGTSPSAVNSRRTHCIHGHLLDETNTRIEGRGKRACRTCDRLKQQRYRSERRSHVSS